jgi:excisionase family DNA binding protein
MGYHVSVKEAADYLKISVASVRMLLNEGWLPGQKVDRSWQIPAAAVETMWARVAQQGVPFVSDPVGEQRLAKHRRCPVCAGAFGSSTTGASSFSNEFLECADCGMSVHQSMITDYGLSGLVAAQGKQLQAKESAGLVARSLLLRRKEALEKLS